METRIVVQPETLLPGSAGPATANIWLESGSIGVPAVGWNDFAIVVLGWWSDALLRLIRGVSSREEVRFMDGPYSVLLDSVGSDRWKLTYVDRTSGHRARDIGVADLGLAESITVAGRGLLEACRAQRLWSDDATRLEGAIADLRRELNDVHGS